MQPFGSDRVRRGSGEQWIIFCRRSKGWVPRTPATLVTTDRPGTAVLWEEQYFEVVSATTSGSGFRYVLEPWREEHVVRGVDVYDEASEQRREADHSAALRQQKHRKTANLLAIFTGHLPTAVQERLANELGILPLRLTLISLILPMTIVGLVVNEWVRRRMEQEVPLPLWVVALAGYLFAESALRFNVAMAQGRGIGSAAGLIAYSVFYLFAPNRAALVPPLELDERGARVTTPLAIDPDVALNDALTVREPLLTLLSAAEQRELTARFAFDYRRMARSVALTILIFTTIGVVTSVMALRDGGGVSPLVSMLVAGALAAEQVVRLRAFSRGPAGSMLAPLVRPFTRKLLAGAPR